MRDYRDYLEVIANDLLDQNVKAKHDENKPNYSNRDFMNATIIFQTAIFDKLWDNQMYIGLTPEETMKMAESCGQDLRDLILKYTALDTHKIEDFLK